jgi:UDP-GlcNAc:undecaprenyl-phosphate GlcNAc-1-phosphate transferase
MIGAWSTVSKPPDAREGIGRFPLWASLCVVALAGWLLVPPIRTLWITAGARWAYILTVSALLGFGLTPVVMRLAQSWRVLDYPDARKVHAVPTPLMGGLAIYTAFGVSLLANSILDTQLVAIVGGATLLVLVGLLDDFRSLPAVVKLVAQLVAVAVVLNSGITIRLFSWPILGDFANGLLTIVWLLGITNAMNFFDGMDGLATGLGIVTALLLAAVAVQTYQPFLGWVAAAIVGSCAGFLPFNFRLRRPAAIFLGDAGSTFLGFTLAALAVKGDWADNSVVDLAAPVLIFWVFIFDMTHITAARILSGRVRSFHDWIAYVGRDHLHHRLAALLGSQRKAVLLIFLLALAVGLTAVALRNARTVDAILLVLQAVIIAVIVSVLEHMGQREHPEA